MRNIASVALLLISASAATAAGVKEIVVTAGRLADFEKALDDCIARKCSANREIVAAVNYAEAQFREGEYRNSIATLDRTIGRTKRAASQFPDAVAALFEARSTLALHDGDIDDYTSNSFKSYSVQRYHGDYGRAGVHIARLHLLDSLIEARKFDYARQQMFAGRREAAAQNQTGFVIAFDVRSAILESITGSRRTALKDVQAILARPEAQTGPARIPALATAAQLARGLKQDGLAKQYSDELASLGAAVPVQIKEAKNFQPAENGTRPGPFEGSALNPPKQADNLPLRWVDVGYTIDASGRAQDIEVLKASSANTRWAGNILELIRTRHFAPPGETPGFNPERRERYTLTAEYVTPIGSLIKRRAGPPVIRLLDLTRDNPVSAAN